MAPTKNLDRLIGARVRGFRRGAHIAAHVAAEACDLAELEYLACEDGKQRFSAVDLYALARLFGTDISDFFTGLD